MTPTDTVLVPARWRDLPVLALVAAQAMGRRTVGKHAAWVLAVAGWPLWWTTLALQKPHLRRMDHRALVVIRPPTATRWPGWPLMLAPIVLGSVVGVCVMFWRPVFWGLVGSILIGLLLYAGPCRGRLAAGPKVHHATPPVSISMAASVRQGSGLLDTTRQQVEELYPGAPVDIVARDEDLVVLYAERLGVTQVRPGRGRMIGVVAR